MGDSVLCVAKSSLLLFCDSHNCCNVFFCFSYHTLLQLHYGSKMQKSQATREWAREVGVSIQEAEHLLDTELFLDEYPRWDIGVPHHPIILHSMFLHAAREGWKEEERFIC